MDWTDAAGALLNNPSRTRWFLVPKGTSLPAGSFEVEDTRRAKQRVDEAALLPFEIDRIAARDFIDQQLDSSFERAGSAWSQVQRMLGGAGLGENPLGMTPGELYTDPSRGREAAERLFTWVTGQVLPSGGSPSARPPDLAETLRRLGEGLTTAAERLREVQEASAERRERPSRAAPDAPTTLQRVGFFRELDHGDADGPILEASVRELPGPHERELVAYLRAGHLLVASPGPVADVLDPTEQPVGTGSIYTDGRFAWPGDLAHYVEHHHAHLPEAFLAFVLENGFRVPVVVDISQLEL